MRHGAHLLLLFLFTANWGYGDSKILEFSAPGASAQQPRLASASGTLYLAYGVENIIYCAVSHDGGKRFSAPVAIQVPGIMSLGRHRGPRIAATEDGAVITAVVGEQGKGRDGNLLSWHSTDHGRTWSEPVKVNDAAESAREGLHGMAAGPGGLFYAVWLDLRQAAEGDRGTKLYGASSKDGGKSWSKNQLVYRSPDGTVCQCCHPSVAIDGQGVIHVMWRNALGGARDLYHAASANGGLTFTSVGKLGQGTWPLDSCPMDGGEVSAGPTGEIATVWRREDKIYLVGTKNVETLLGTGRNPVVAQTKTGKYVAWEDATEKSGVLLSPGSSQPMPIGQQSRYLDLAVSGPNLVAAWEESRGGRKVVLFQIIQ